MAATQTETTRHGRKEKTKQVNIGKTERWISMVGGSLLALYGLTRRSKSGKALALAGGYLAYRGKTGHSGVYQALGINTAERQGHGVEVEKAITVNRSPEEVYNFWRDLENLPRFMENVESVKYLGDGRSHWVVKTPIGTTVQWDSVVTREIENEVISWHSVEGAEIENEGEVRFRRAPGGRGTEVRFMMRFTPPGVMAGSAFSKLLGSATSRQVENDLSRFKQIMETGEPATIKGQPSG